MVIFNIPGDVEMLMVSTPNFPRENKVQSKQFIHYSYSVS